MIFYKLGQNGKMLKYMEILPLEEKTDISLSLPWSVH